MDFSNMPMDELGEDASVTIELEDGSKIECAIIAIYPASNGKQYIALLPDKPEDGEEDEIYLYRYRENEDGEDDIDNIESDEEYEIATDAFDELLDSWEFDEMASDDEK